MLEGRTPTARKASLNVTAAACPPYEHLVHLYESEATFARCVVAFLAPALLEEAAVVVATPEHRAVIAAELERCGVDVGALRREGRYVEHDAEELLARFFLDGRVDDDAFDRSVGALVRDAARAFGRVHLYGEQVTCLWGRGDSRSSAELERAWTALAGEVDFRLCCAYPLRAMAEAGRG